MISLRRSTGQGITQQFGATMNFDRLEQDPPLNIQGTESAFGEQTNR